MDARTIKELAKTAMDIQDACNARAVARFYVALTDELTYNGIRDTLAIRNHPAVVLVAHKLADLSGVASISGDTYHQAYVACLELAEDPIADILADVA